jgi:PAS domain-containing protein
MTELPDWVQELPAAVTVCDADGTILGLNERACRTFAEDGGAALVGRNVLDCHPEPARSTLRAMLAAGRRNVYTIEKNGLRKLIYQTPWYSGGAYRGFVELSLELPETMTHFVRK